MNWPLLKYLFSMICGPWLSEKEARRDFWLRVTIGLLILLVPACAWGSRSPYLFYNTVWSSPLDPRTQFGLALCWGAFMVQLFLGVFIGCFQVSLLSQRWVNAGVESLFLAVGSARGTCLTLVIPGFVGASYRVLLALPLYGIAVVYGDIGWGAVAWLNAVTYAGLACCCCLGTFLTDFDKIGRVVVAYLVAGFFVAVGVYRILAGSASTQYLPAASMVLLVVGVAAFERAVRRVNREIAGPRAVAPSARRLRSRRAPARARGDAIRALLMLGLRWGRHVWLVAAGRVIICAGALGLAVLPPLAFHGSGWFVSAKTMAGLRALRERRVLEDLLLTSGDERQFASTLFSVFFRRNLVVVPGLALATTVGSLFLFLVFWVFRTGTFAFGQAFSWFLTTPNVIALAIVSLVTGCGVALAHVFCLTATACEKQSRWQHAETLSRFSPLKSRLAMMGGAAFDRPPFKSRLAIVGGAALGTLVLLCLRFGVYGPAAGFRLSQVTSSHILFCLCLGLPATFVGASSYERFIKNFDERFTTAPQSAPGNARVLSKVKNALDKE